MAQSHILEAIYDGPIDTRGFDYQPVILEKLPTLADGDAALEPVAVQAGDRVVDNRDELVPLEPGVVVRPFGCTAPECAVTWDGSPLEMAQLSAVFTLREELKWSDGEPLTADDSVFSYQIARNCQGDSGACGRYGLVTRRGWDTVERTASYTALDERTVRWMGVPGFLTPQYQVNFFIPLPEHVLAGSPPEELFEAQEAARQPLGWGPYRIDRWVPGDHIRLLKNPYYFRAGEGLPRFDQVIFRFVGLDAEKNLYDLMNGACDVLDQKASLVLQDGQIESLLEYDSAGQLDAHFATGTVWEHADFGIRPISYDDGYQLGVDRPDFFGDPRTRQAIALCMDRQQVVETVLHGLSAVPDSYLPAEHPLFNPHLPKYSFDPSAGATLLTEVGWIDDDGNPGTPRVARGVPNVLDGTPLKFTYATTTATQRQGAAKILAESLAQCGIGVELQIAEGSVLFAPGPEGSLFGRQFELAQFAWLTGVQPPCDLWTTEQIPGDPNILDENGVPLFPMGWGGQNETGYSNPEYDQACRSAQESLPGQAGYVESHLKVQEIFASELPVIPLYLRLTLAVTRPDLCGFTLDPTSYSEMWNIEAFDFGEDC
jgi:peptide/nickel transport system substrate-binding protein